MKWDSNRVSVFVCLMADHVIRAYFSNHFCVWYILYVCYINLSLIICIEVVHYEHVPAYKQLAKV